MVKKNADKLMFGTAGIPLSAKGKSVAEGVMEIKKLGLDCMEVEFVYGVRMKNEVARKTGEVSEELDIPLTVHGPYYINLNAQEDDKYEASIKRILDTARKGYLFGARSVTFHGAFRMGKSDAVVSERVRVAITRIIDELAREGVNTVIAPELTGKPTQWGSIDELIELCKTVENVRLCIDFSHHYARNIGTKNSYEDFMEVLDGIESNLGRKYLDNLHMHASGIAYGPKGERNHLFLEKSEFNYKDLVKALHYKKVKGYLICESPAMEEDALLLKNYYHSL